MKLTIELVPKTSFYNNVRKILTRSEWKKISKETSTKANNICEICGGVSWNRSLDCHEIWEYDDINHIQTFKRFIALCTKCHEVKHIGKAEVDGHLERAAKHFMKINNINHYAAQRLLQEAFDLWAERSQYNWTIDISII